MSGASAHGPRGARRRWRPSEAGGRGSVRAGQVFAAALRLFRERGYHATSMQDIADAVGLYKGSLYHYISSKEDLLVRAFEHAMRELLAEVEAIVADRALSPADQLRRAIRAHVAAVAGNLDALTVYLHEWRTLAGEAAATVAEQRERYEALVGEIIRRGVRSGDFLSRDPPIATLGVLGMCNWLYHWYSPSGRLRPDQIADELADLVLEGLTAPARAAATPPSGPAPARPASRQTSG